MTVNKPASPTVRLEGIRKNFGNFVALRDVHLEVSEGEFVTILGASGSGKTTCLRTVAGFVQPNAGKVFIGGADVTSVPPYLRNTGMVFQHFALFPHMNVARNVSYGLTIRRIPKAEAEKRTLEALRLVHLEDFAHRYPQQLSGGQKQRVALARAVVIRPKVLLLDEPLGALDLKLREELQVEIKRVQQTLGITTLSVTHDQGEALSMSDRVVVMSEGRILQADTPTGLYQRPNSIYVANFVGRMNLLPVTVLERDSGGKRYTLTLDKGENTIEVEGEQAYEFSPGEHCFVAFRPEDAQFREDLRNRVSATVDKVTYRGSSWVVSCIGSGERPVFVSVAPSADIPALNSKTTISWSAKSCRLLKAEEKLESSLCS